MARLTGEAVSEKFDKVGRFVANVTKGLGVGVAILGLAGCPQPTNGGDINPSDKPTTHTVNNAGYDLVIPKPEIGWSNTRAQNEVSTIMTFLKGQCEDLYTYAQNYQNDDDMGIGLVVNTVPLLNVIKTTTLNQSSISLLSHEFDSVLGTLNDICFPNIIGNSNMPSFKAQLKAFQMGSRAEQQNFMCKTIGGQFVENTQTKQNAQDAFDTLITDIKQNYGVNNLPQQSGDYKTTLAQLRANLNGFIPATANKAFFNNLLQMVEDVEQFIGFVTDLGGLQKNVQLQAQAANKSNVKIAFPEPQAQPKLSRAEIQAQHGIVNSEELLHG
jgi:hypothetical protein